MGEIPEELKKKWLETKRGVVLTVLADMGGEASIDDVVKKCTELAGDRGWRRVIRAWTKRGLLGVEGNVVKIKDLAVDPDYRRIVLKQKPVRRAKKEEKPEDQEYLLPKVFTIKSRWGIIQTNDAKEITNLLRQKYIAETGTFEKDAFLEWIQERYPELTEYLQIIQKVIDKGGEQ